MSESKTKAAGGPMRRVLCPLNAMAATPANWAPGPTGGPTHYRCTKCGRTDHSFA